MAKARKCVSCGKEMDGEASKVDFSVCDGCKVLPFDKKQAVIGNLVAKYNVGQVEGVLILVKNPDGTFETASAGLGYVEKLGLLEAEVGKIHFQALVEPFLR